MNNLRATLSGNPIPTTGVLSEKQPSRAAGAGLDAVPFRAGRRAPPITA